MKPNASNIFIYRLPAIIRKVVVNALRQSEGLRKIAGARRSLTHGKDNAFERAVTAIDFYAGELRKKGSSFDGKRVLEIGTGDSLAVALGLTALGCERVVTMDPACYLKPHQQNKSVYERVVEQYGSPESAQKMLDRIEYVHHQAENMPETWDETFDLVISNSVIEHVKNVGVTFQNIARVMKRNGRTIHKIDLSSHHHMKVESSPLEFLMFPEWLWHLVSRQGSLNRVRYPQIIDAIQSSAMTVEEVEHLDCLPDDDIREIRPRLSNPFRHMTCSDLKTLSFSVIASKRLVRTFRK